MSQFPNTQQGYYGRPLPTSRPSSSGSAMQAGLPNLPTYPGSATNSPVPSQPFNTAHIQQLTDFHRQQAMLAQEQRQASPVPQQQQLQAAQLAQVVQQQRLQAQQQQQRIQQMMQNSQLPISSHQMQMQQLQQFQQNGQRPIMPQQQRPITPQQLAMQQPLQQQQQKQPLRYPSAQPQPQQPQQPQQPPAFQQPSQQPFNLTFPPNRAAQASQPAPARPSNTIRRPSTPVSQVFTPPAQGIPSPSPVKVEDPSAGPSKPKKRRDLGGLAEKERKPKPKRDRRDAGLPQAVYFAAIEPTTREHPPTQMREPRERERERVIEARYSPAPADVRRRRDEGMRGSMRNESEGLRLHPVQ